MGYREIIENAIAAGREVLPEHEAYQLCEEFGIAYPPTRFATTREDAVEAAESLGYPVVLKVVSAAVVHKSDAGGVIVGIASQSEFKDAYDLLFANVKEKAGDVPVDGVLVQKAMPKAAEVVVGGLKDDLFGPVVMFGSGGILVEIFKDVSFRLAPLDRDEAMRQIKETKAYEILKGVRGAPPSDLDALADLIVKAGKLLSTLPEIRELDFNPVFAGSDGAVVVDARMVIRG